MALEQIVTSEAKGSIYILKTVTSQDPFASKLTKLFTTLTIIYIVEKVVLPTNDKSTAGEITRPVMDI